MTSSADHPSLTADAAWVPLAAATPAAPVAPVDWEPPPLGAGPARRPSADPLPRIETDAEEAHSRGYAAGLRDGAARAESHVRPAVEALQQVLAFLADDHEEFVRVRARNLECLALAVARHLVGRELAADPVALATLVTRALELLPGEEGFEIRLHPEDLAVLSAMLANPGEGAAPGMQVRWLPDAHLARGDFVVETPQRMVDGRSDVALRAIYERLDADD